MKKLIEQLIDQLVFLGFLFGLTVLTVSPLLLITSCSDNNKPPPSPQPGQWYFYPGGALNGTSFNFPGPGSAVGYVYQVPTAIPKPGQMMTLNYSVTGDNPVWQNNPSGGDSGAPTMHLFLWRKGDDLSCGGNPPGDYRAQYRMFALKTPLVLGDDMTISAQLTPGNWTGCYNGHSTTEQWSDLLNNLLGAGFTFGGQNFAGHGIYVSSGSAKFTIKSLTIQ